MFSYLKILRIPHWPKNFVVLLGLLFAMSKPVLYPDLHIPFVIILSVTLACLISSSNYIINQIVDSESDKHHPVKKFRPIPKGEISKKNSLIFTFLIFFISMLLSLFYIKTYTSLSLLGFFLAGIIYNVPPIRLKDKAYVDVISESVNNPLRFLIGWYTISNATPSIPFLLFLWSSGASLMSIKRFFELRSLNVINAINYRKSYKDITPRKLVFLSIGWLILSLIFLSKSQIF
ncbi:hypothetical protein A2767_05805 [Candidatus Roizmanbacteria bacterium RIFCSPHIGHO2_01_FULL_35_10]|uniref:Decaprenyl-phosphate phosphoribosyltransferase n=1 Tax=Candidatus Roizmanbacteria bacterium RIFCSPLOWO2_01_FULL_35_13 TaxID=1802055 RepID=A0A1F7I6Y2_9BACT|nr:MAG: hypothetical protein A2767_05805 [Candidatus Roizmanbacteria bacterium RIFCSPHIGHO2_01_FULL_35_10]OGK39103.1 MAG: hypothetical protein A3A74_05765 [Candidatus Roizmanbacteria bacterium RIFCSPLOWO2_01_FULL_35_13]